MGAPVQSSWERVRARALIRLEFLEVKEETKSNLSYGSRISSSSSVSKLLGLTAKRAALEQKIIFADMIKEQEKTLAKLKLQQELSETLAEEAVYEIALNAEMKTTKTNRFHRWHPRYLEAS